MTGRVKIIRVTTEIKAGRKEPTTEVFYECWCDVQSLGTNEKSIICGIIIPLWRKSWMDLIGL